jgi:hypothetical protein
MRKEGKKNFSLPFFHALRKMQINTLSIVVSKLHTLSAMIFEYEVKVFFRFIFLMHYCAATCLVTIVDFHLNPSNLKKILFPWQSISNVSSIVLNIQYSLHSEKMPRDASHLFFFLYSLDIVSNNYRPLS